MTGLLTVCALPVDPQNEFPRSSRNKSKIMPLIENSLTCPFKFFRDITVVFWPWAKWSVVAQFYLMMLISCVPRFSHWERQGYCGLVFFLSLYFHSWDTGESSKWKLSQFNLKGPGRSKLPLFTIWLIYRFQRVFALITWIGLMPKSFELLCYLQYKLAPQKYWSFGYQCHSSLNTPYTWEHNSYIPPGEREE